MDALKSLVQPLIGGGGGSSMVDGVKLVVLGGTIETVQRMANSGWYESPCAFLSWSLLTRCSQESLD